MNLWNRHWLAFSLVGLLATISLACGSKSEPESSSYTPSESSSTSSESATVTTDHQAPAANVGADSSPGAMGAPQRTVDSASYSQTYDATTSTSDNYWSSDWCHYWYQNNTWYSDYCLRSVPDANNQPIPNSYYLYAYPANGQPIEQLSGADPGYTEIRYLDGDSLFKIVQWIRWPSNQTGTVANMDFYVYDQSLQTWKRYTAQSLTPLIGTAAGANYGFPVAGTTSGRTGSNVTDFTQYANEADWEQNTSIADWVSGVGGALSRRTLEPNCTLSDVTCYYD